MSQPDSVILAGAALVAALALHFIWRSRRPDMTLPELFHALGIDPSVVTAGTAGGLLRALSRRRFKFREVIAAPVCGALAAAYLTVPAIHYLTVLNVPLPSSDNAQATQNATAFFIGVVAMWIADIALELLVRRIKGPAEPV